jgi:uncharacterized repeat protein (TIGR03803 family)
MKKIESYRVRILALVVLAMLSAAIPAYAQTYSVVYNFGSHTGDPIEPGGPALVAQGRDGNLYSTSNSGGAKGSGTVFKISPVGQLKVIYSFCSQANCADGRGPESGLSLGPDGSFYGTTVQGGTTGCYGSFGCGTIFKITPGGSLTTLYRFTGGNDGRNPYGPPSRGRDGLFYGTASRAGTSDCGTLYRITTSGAFTLLYEFDNVHGCFSTASPVLGTDGNFYGNVLQGGTAGLGVIYQFKPSGKLTVLHNFVDTDGVEPWGPLVEGRDGNFYGITYGTHFSNDGVVFRITASGVLTVLYTQNGTTDGANPIAGLVQATDGNFYGAASAGGLTGTCDPGGCGTIFKVTPAGGYSVIYLPDGTTGDYPEATLVQHTNGLLYGDTFKGGNVQSCVALHNLDICGLFYSWDNELPAFVSLLPYAGKVGATIEFLGQGFTSASTVSFNGTAAKVLPGTGTYLGAIVPSGATTGFVKVTASGGTLTSNKKFIVMP